MTESRPLVLTRIGTLRTPFRTRADCPRNSRLLDPPPPCRAEILPEFRAGLTGLEGFSHLIFLYWLDQVGEAEMVITPRFTDRPRGVFATRSPVRPNPIGLSVVAFDGFAGEDVLAVHYLDCVDGTPLLDIKPYLTSIDCEPSATMGWLAKPSD